MITRRTKVQLMIFAIITLLGVSYVGARYAQLDRLVVSRTYDVVAHFEESGGAFAGALVTYRGVGIGKVEEMVLTDEGVDLHLEIENEFDDIPADSLAVVGNRSAVGEQYVELQPQSDAEPFLEQDSEIESDRTAVPISTDTLLTNLSETVDSVDPEDLRIATTEAGDAFAGTGEELQTIIDSGNTFINAADANFEVTTDLIRDANVVLNGQIDSEQAFRRFARDLSSFSTTVANNDADLRRLIDNGSAGANQLRTFLEENEVQLGELINNLVTTGEIVVKHIDGVEQLLVLYPYVVEGGFTVVSKTPSTGLYDAHFGAIDVVDPPVCSQGYESTNRRSAVSERGNAPMNEQARCTEPPTSNSRGAQNIPPPRAATGWSQDNLQADVAYDPATGEVTWGRQAVSKLQGGGSVAPATLGEETWKWLYLQPLLAQD